MTRLLMHRTSPPNPGTTSNRLITDTDIPCGERKRCVKPKATPRNRAAFGKKKTASSTRVSYDRHILILPEFSCRWSSWRNYSNALETAKRQTLDLRPDGRDSGWFLACQWTFIVDLTHSDSYLIVISHIHRIHKDSARKEKRGRLVA